MDCRVAEQALRDSEKVRCPFYSLTLLILIPDSDPSGSWFRASTIVIPSSMSITRNSQAAAGVGIPTEKSSSPQIHNKSGRLRMVLVISTGV